MLRSVCAGGNLLAAVQENGAEDIRRILLPAFNDGIDGAAKSFEPIGLSWEAPPPNFGHLLQSLLQTTQSLKVAAVNQHTADGIRYATYQHSPRDSHVCYRKKASRRFGRIVGIIAYRYHRSPDDSVNYVAQVAPFYLGDRLRGLDVYRPWGEVAGQLFDAKLEDPQLLSFEDIVCHAMFRPYKEATESQLVHLMALDKASGDWQDAIYLKSNCFV
jgi:hypothetical protein